MQRDGGVHVERDVGLRDRACGVHRSTASPVSTWSWTFGDGGTSTVQNTIACVRGGGNVHGDADGDVGRMLGLGDGGTNYITVTAPPVAAFVGAPVSGTSPLSVSFTDQSTGGPNAWSWNLGTRGHRPSRVPTHVYTAAGTYTVTLTATNACGSDLETKVGYVTVTTPGTQCDDSRTGASRTG